MFSKCFLFPLIFTVVLACSSARFVMRMAGKFRTKVEKESLSAVLETPDWLQPSRISTASVEQTPPAPKSFGGFEKGVEFHTRWVEATKVCAEQSVPFRERLIALNVWLFDKTTDSVRSSSVVSGKDGWLFLQAPGYGHCIEDYRGMERFTEDQMDEIRQALNSLHQILEARGIRFCFLVAPNKENVYPEFMPPDIPRFSSLSRVDVLMAALAGSGNVPVCNAKPALLDAKHTCELYYPTDTHWNQVGAYVGVQGVFKTLGRTHIPLEERTVEQQPDCDLRDLARMAGKTQKDFLNATFWFLPELRPIPTGWEDNDDWKKTTTHINPEARSSDSVLLLGDSFTVAMIPALLEEFREVRPLHTDLCATLKSELDDFHPDCVVYEVVERDVGSIGGIISAILDSFKNTP